MTARPFLIVGTPRSRTAWLAALCNAQPGVICYHEPIAYHPDWQAAAALLQDRDHEFAGISDSGFSFHLAHLVPTYRPRVLIVDRPEAEVDASLAGLGIPQTNYLDLLAEALEPWRGHSLVMSVAFDTLGDDFTVWACLSHLLPGVCIDMAKIALFQRLNVQTDMAMVWQSAAGRDMAGIAGPDVARRLDFRPRNVL